jgi:transposase
VRADVAQARATWHESPAGVGGIAPERLVFLDECGVLTNMVRPYGRSPRGQRAHAKVPFGHWKRLSVLGAIGTEGMIATLAVEAATDGAIFAAYLEQVLLPVLRRHKPDAVLMMDNLRPHKTKPVRTMLDQSGFAYRYLPPYSPDMNPIEPAWAKVKTGLRRAAARTTEALHQALGPALSSITAEDATGYFRHCGYARVRLK